MGQGGKLGPQQGWVESSGTRGRENERPLQEVCYRAGEETGVIELQTGRRLEITHPSPGKV